MIFSYKLCDYHTNRFDHIILLIMTVLAWMIGFNVTCKNEEYDHENVFG